MAENSYTPAQASAVAKLPLKALQKLIDVRLIRSRRMRSGREPSGFSRRNKLVYLRLEAEGVRLLPLATRREVERTVVSKPEVRSIAVAPLHTSIQRVRLIPPHSTLCRRLIQ